MRKRRMALIALAAVAVPLSLINASWIAPKPKGKLILVAHRGVAQQFDRTGVGKETCTANRIRPLEHNYIENTLHSMLRAIRLGADAIELDVHPTADGQMVVFHDWRLECRTNGKGPIRKHRLADLKKLDVGYGYTADGGRTFPLRGRGIGGMPTVEDVLQQFPEMRFVFNFKSRDPRDADLLLAAIQRAGVKVDEKYSFYGHPKVTSRLKQLAPGAWTWWKGELRGCAEDYMKVGWTGYVPQSCRNSTIALPLNYRWAFWGWPYRFLDRMAKHNTKVILLGDYKDGEITGLERPEQLGHVPRHFKGYVWVEDIYNVGRALN